MRNINFRRDQVVVRVLVDRFTDKKIREIRLYHNIPVNRCVYCKVKKYHTGG